jgi:hypothetical protein
MGLFSISKKKQLYACNYKSRKCEGFKNLTKCKSSDKDQYNNNHCYDYNNL